MKELQGTIIFEGKTDYSERKMAELAKITEFIRRKDGGQEFLQQMKLVSIVAGTSERNLIYAGKKQEAAASLGLNLEILNLGEDASAEIIAEKINELKADSNVAGIMIQLPLGEKSKSETRNLIKLIPKEKDLDGMNEDPEVVAPVAEGICVITKFGVERLGLSKSSLEVVVIGAKGFVGTKTIQRLNSEGFRTIGIDLDTPEEERLNIIKNAKAIVSVCNQPDSIHADMLSDSDLDIGIDGSYPHGDFADDTIGKIKVAAVVPGGVGPMTIAALMEKFVKRLVSIAGERQILNQSEVDKLMGSLV